MKNKLCRNRFTCKLGHCYNGLCCSYVIYIKKYNFMNKIWFKHNHFKYYIRLLLLFLYGITFFPFILVYYIKEKYLK